ncbi:MAG: class IV adenylate cyclase [Treponema sp.]|jgi:adenylate cyclase class 2|nr:class IV adenylate cyclase [Treponema sp.]
MQIEIEVKAWVDEPEKIKSALSLTAEYRGKILKQDEYWLNPPSPGVSKAISTSGIRIRQEEAEDAEGTVREAVIVTYKTKEVRDGMEINQEWEFRVSDRAAFEELLNCLGFTRGCAKEKSGFAWNHEGITAELTHVPPLGWFVELEILAADDAETTVQSARGRLLDLLGRVGIGEDRIETRYYSEMLQAAGNPPCVA